MHPVYLQIFPVSVNQPNYKNEAEKNNKGDSSRSKQNKAD
jgi:hypothetical protein